MNSLLTAVPAGIAESRLQVIGRLASLLESQTRTSFFGDSLLKLIEDAFREILQTVAEHHKTEAIDSRDSLISRIGGTWQRLRTGLDLLRTERTRQWDKNNQTLRDIIVEFDRMFAILAESMVERDLLERQSQVLEQIILSHERIGQWKAFVQAILSDFHSIFPFDVFFVAFAEEHGLLIYVYYFGECSDEVRNNIRHTLSVKMRRSLGLAEDSPLDFEEFTVMRTDPIRELRAEQMITVKVPDHSTHLAGLLGVTFLSAVELDAREEAVVRSILAVMVMVVGSSKVLSRTLGELEYYSMHDPLTGLYNRRHFNNMLEYEIGRSERHQHEFALLLLDLDNFKDVNDSYGHPVGDQVLTELAEVLRAHLRKGDLATRIGGDEFALLLTETNQEGAIAVAQKLGRALRERRFSAPNGKQFHITASIGIARYPEDAQSMADLLAGVDIAMYRAKELGKDGACTLESAPQQLRVTRESRDYAEKLRVALREERMLPYFQPIVNCRTGELFACETLARLRERTGETIGAGMFIETIEKYGLGRELDRTIISQTLNRAAALIADGAAPPRLFFNLSSQEIQGRGILSYAEELCQRLGIPPSNVVFEILERDAIGDMTNMRKFLAKLRDKGFAFALDDFGSGYNSFHYLRELHFEFVKIDGAFVRNILESEIDRALVRNLSNLCQDIGIRTVAESVESEEILEMLRHMGIDYVQGYHIAMPGPELTTR